MVSFSNFHPEDYHGTATEKLAALRTEIARQKLDYLIVPHADEYGNEWLAAYAERLAWLTNFTGSVGTALISQRSGELFVPALYLDQAREEVGSQEFAVKSMAETPLHDYLAGMLKQGDRVGFDPCLHTIDDAEALQKICAKMGASLAICQDNLIDRIWRDQPEKPMGKVIPHTVEHAGQSSCEKRHSIASSISKGGEDVTIITRTDSIAWLLNIRGSDIDSLPLPFSRLILFSDGSASFFVSPRKAGQELKDHVGPDVTLLPEELFSEAVLSLGLEKKTVLVEKSSAPAVIGEQLKYAGANISYGLDPCVLPKAVKNEIEIEGARRAHVLDGLCLTRFLYWLDSNVSSGKIDEIGTAKKLASFRRDCLGLKGLAFPSIAASGPNAAIPHYVPTSDSNRTLRDGDIFMIDSGGQYAFGTTDVTRTVAIGAPTDEMKDRFTRVLKGHIALAQAVFPEGTTGAHLDVLARLALWEEGLDYGHATGHGIGSYLCVHEGPHFIGAKGHTPLRPGMLVTNEPGYYKPEAYGMRIESVMLVVDAGKCGEAGKRFFGFEVLTLAPIDLALVDISLLSKEELDWLNAYHHRVVETLKGELSADETAWLRRATKEMTYTKCL